MKTDFTNICLKFVEILLRAFHKLHPRVFYTNVCYFDIEVQNENKYNKQVLHFST